MLATSSEVFPRQRAHFRSLGAGRALFLLTLFLLGTSKWGSYLPFARPPYISDLVLAAVVLGQVLWGRKGRRRAILDDGTPLWALAALLLLWISLEFIWSTFSLSAVRDFVPYFYVVIIFLVREPPSADGLRSARQEESRLLTAVLVFHAVWCSASSASATVYEHLPYLAGQIYVLQPRNDFDGAICGVFAALCLHRALSGVKVIQNLSFAAWNAILVLYLRERAGTLAFLFALLIIVWLRRHRAKSPVRRKAMAVVPLITLALPLIIVAGSATPGYQRLLAAVHSYVPFIHSDPAYASATGTQTSREKAWSRIVTWIDDSDKRVVVGVGFGTDFMHESGADILLLGGPQADVRSPHNYFVGTWARLGIIGDGLVVFIVMSGFALARTVRRWETDLSEVDVLAILLSVAIPVAAAVGVILESPFGAVPYFWALGHLSSRAALLRRRGIEENSSQSSKNRPVSLVTGAPSISGV